MNCEGTFAAALFRFLDAKTFRVQPLDRLEIATSR
jgi:hypothetical protein